MVSHVVWLFAATAASQRRSSSLLAANKLYPEVVPAFPTEAKALIRRVGNLEKELDATRSELGRARGASKSRASAAPQARATPSDTDAADTGVKRAAVAARSWSTWSGAINLVLWLNLAAFGAVCSYVGVPVPAWACAGFGLFGSSLALLLLAHAFVSNLYKSVTKMLGIDDKPLQGKLRCFRCRDIYDIPRGAKTAACPYCNTLNEVEPSNLG